MSERDRRPQYDSLENIHKDVHGIRRQLLDAIERSQTALMNRLSLISAKIDRLSPPASGDNTITEEDKSRMTASLAKLSALASRVKAFDEQN